MSFELCSSERVVQLSGKEYRVEAPSFGMGLQILYALDNLEDKDDKEFLFQTLGKLEWNTSFIIPALRIANKNSPLRFRIGIRKYVMQGFELPKEVEKELKDSDKKPQIPQWRYLLARYCQYYNTSPREVWFETPFTMFLHMNKEIEGIRYRQRIERSMGVGAGMGAVDEKTTKKWDDIAYGTAFKEQESTNGKQAEKEVDYKAELEREREHLKNRL